MFYTGFADEAATKLEGQIKAVKQLGWHDIELRTIEGKMVHDLSLKQLESVKEEMEKNSITCCSLGTSIANWGKSITEPFEETKALVLRSINTMKILNIKYARIMSYNVLKDSEGRVSEDQMEEERIKRLRWICDSFEDNGMMALHENCFNFGGLSWKNTLKLVDAVPNLGLIFDTGNAPMTIDIETPFPYGYQNSLDFYKNVEPFIKHVHIKDGYRKQDGTEVYTFPGEGSGQVKETLSLLKASGYDGGLSIEPHMEVVFHDSKIKANEEDMTANFIEYGKRLEKLYNSL